MTTSASSVGAYSPKLKMQKRKRRLLMCPDCFSIHLSDNPCPMCESCGSTSKEKDLD